jgi:hypothetical protein
MKIKSLAELNSIVKTIIKEEGIKERFLNGQLYSFVVVKCSNPEEVKEMIERFGVIPNSIGETVEYNKNFTITIKKTKKLHLDIINIWN